MHKKLLKYSPALSLLLLTSLHAADCPPDMPAPCYSPPEPECDMCLGPTNVASSACVRPYTCNGDWSIHVAGFYWNAHEDGLDYVLESQVDFPFSSSKTLWSLLHPTQTTTTLVDSNFIAPFSHFGQPRSNWNFGFKLGANYNSLCDCWDFEILWTSFKTSTHRSDDSDETSLLPLWSDFGWAGGGPLVASGVDAEWKLNLNLIDIEMGREFWNSRKLTLRPYVGVRVAFINQKFDMDFRGGSWDSFAAQPTLVGELDMKNNFKGAGIRTGLDSVWNITSGWGFYGNFAASLIYGLFSVKADEMLRQPIAPFGTTPVMETKESFRAVRSIVDLALGVQWQTMFCNCRYALFVNLGYEQHLFFNQNQMWKVNRLVDTDSAVFPTNLGENSFVRSRGDLDTQGVTLSFRFEF